MKNKKRINSKKMNLCHLIKRKTKKSNNLESKLKIFSALMLQICQTLKINNKSLCKHQIKMKIF